MGSSEERIIKTRLTPTKSLAGALTTLVICVALFLLLPRIMGGSGYIEAVKKGHPNAYPNITFEEAFGKFYSNPKWNYGASSLR